MCRNTVRVYQERWFPFQNLPAALKEFEAKTGVTTELVWDSVGVGTLEHMFDQMTESFHSPNPAYDLICADEVILQQMGDSNLVEDLAPRMRADNLQLDDVTEATRQSAMQGEKVLGLPCVNVSGSLLYRRDLFEKYGLHLPQTWDELKSVASDLQSAVRADGRADFYGFETRGASGGGHSVWTIGTFLGSFGARWINLDGTVNSPDDRHFDALKTYLEILNAVSPPEQNMISFPEMRRDFAAGRVGMIMDVGMEYAHLFATNSELADRSGVALVPGGPAGRAPNLYSPLWSIPASSHLKDEAFELAKFLTSKAQLLEDGLKSNALETSSLEVLHSDQFSRYFRSDLLEVSRLNSTLAQQERPISRGGLKGCEIVGNMVTNLLEKKVSISQALQGIYEELTKLLATGTDSVNSQPST
jgi:ABC-type glycerol-3-phosphate transport system substrate-binding protein